MPKKDEIKDFYFNTREVAESLEPGITDEVEKEFGVDGTPDEQITEAILRLQLMV